MQCYPFPIPNIGDTDMIRSMEGFTFVSALDLNIGYYHIKLYHEADSQKLCTIVFPWRVGEYKYKCLPMGIKIAWFPDVFQNIMSKLVQDMEYVKTVMLSSKVKFE
jgi:hypothetical protein